MTRDTFALQPRLTLAQALRDPSIFERIPERTQDRVRELLEKTTSNWTENEHAFMASIVTAANPYVR